VTGPRSRCTHATNESINTVKVSLVYPHNVYIVIRWPDLSW
jgi:hypothetical protein